MAAAVPGAILNLFPDASSNLSSGAWLRPELRALSSLCDALARRSRCAAAATGRLEAAAEGGFAEADVDGFERLKCVLAAWALRLLG